MALGAVFAFAVRAFWVVAAVYWATDAGLEPYQLVLLGTALEAGVLVAEVPTGVVADVVSRRLSVVISFVGVGLAIVAAGTTTSFPLLLGTQLLLGVSWTFQSGADTAWVTDELGGADVSRLLVRRARAELLATVAGAVAGAALAALTTLPIAIVAAGALLGLAGFAFRALMPESGFARQPGRTWRTFRTILVEGARTTRRTSTLRVLVVVMVLLGAGSEAVDRLDVKRLVDVGLPADTEAVLWIMGLTVLQAAAGWLLLHRIESAVADRPAPPVYGAVVITAAGAVILVAVVPNVWAVSVLLIGQAALRHAADPVTVAWANRRAPAAVRATVLSFVGQSEAVGELLGGLALGAVAALAGLPVALAVAAGLFGASGALALRHRAVEPVG